MRRSTGIVAYTSCTVVRHLFYAFFCVFLALFVLAKQGRLVSKDMAGLFLIPILLAGLAILGIWTVSSTVNNKCCGKYGDMSLVHVVARTVLFCIRAVVCAAFLSVAILAGEGVIGGGIPMAIVCMVAGFLLVPVITALIAVPGALIFRFLDFIFDSDLDIITPEPTGDNSHGDDGYTTYYLPNSRLGNRAQNNSEVPQPTGTLGNNRPGCAADAQQLGDGKGEFLSNPPPGAPPPCSPGPGAPPPYSPGPGADNYSVYHR